MVTKEYILTVISEFFKREKFIKHDKKIQKIYDTYKFGYSLEDDIQLLNCLQEYNMSQEIPYLASGQNGYFSEQIEKNGLGNFRLQEEDIDDAKFIAQSFNCNCKIFNSNTKVPNTYTTLLGTVEFDYATDPFPAGIMEDVFQCDCSHNFPIKPLVGEREEDFYLRLLEYQITQSKTFDYLKKEEVIFRAKKLISRFCSKENVVYLIPLKDVLNLKATFGDDTELRYGALTDEQVAKRIAEHYTLKELLERYSINNNSTLIYNDANMTSDYGICLYGIISIESIHYIKVERKYQLMQKRAIDEGYQIGDEIPETFDLSSKKNNKK